MSNGVSGPDPSGLGPPPHLGASEPPDGGTKPSFVTRYALAQKAGEAAVQAAKPLSRNRYKVQLARVAVQRALLAAAGMEV